MFGHNSNSFMADCFSSIQRVDAVLKHCFCQLLAVIIFLGMAGHAEADPGFDFTTIDVPGAETTAALGINDSGRIVGFFKDAAGTHGFLRRPGILFPIYTTIDVPGATATIARGINDLGHQLLMSGCQVSQYHLVWSS
jgi:hypothetical protein